MDVSPLCTDGRTPSPPALTNSQTGDSDYLPLLQSSTENMLSAHETGADTVSELLDPADKSTETLSNDSKSLRQEISTDSDSLKPDCWSLCPFGPSEPVLPLTPHLSHSIMSPLRQSDFKDPALSSLIQENSPVSSTSDCLKEPSVNEPRSSCTFSSDHSQATCLSRSRSHQSDSLKSDAAVAPVSELHIFESETQDVTLSPTVEPDKIECPEYQPLSKTGGDHGSDLHVIMCDSKNLVTHCHHGSSQEQTQLDCDSDVKQCKRLMPPAADAPEAGLMSVNDIRGGKAEVTGLTPQLRCSNSPTEMWLDACQYLTGEDTEDKDALDKTGQSVTQVLTVTSDLAFPATETLVSGCNPDGSEGIGWSDDDMRGWGPPVERWSSVDSWASALSDWTGIITALPEDLTAAFTEIGAEIDALRQALAEVNTHTDTETSKDGTGQEPPVQVQLQQPMGVQDQPLKAQDLPESSVLSGRSCLSLCTGHELQDREGSPSFESLCDTTPATEGEKEEIQSREAEFAPHPTQASVVSPGATVASPGGCGVDLIPESAYSADVGLSHFDGCVESFETDVFMSNNEYPAILNITEDADREGQRAPAELLIEEPFADALCEVTDEDRRPISQLGSAAEQEAQRSFVPVEVDREGPDLRFLATQTPTNPHVPVVDTQPGPHINVRPHVPPDTSLDFDRACRLDPQWDSPKFITPLATLGIGSSLVCQTSSRARGDQTCAKRSFSDIRDPCCDHIKPCIPWPTSDGIIDKPSSEGEESIHKKENTADTHCEKSSPEGRLALNTTESFFTETKNIFEEINDLGRKLSNLAVVPADHFIISEKKRVAVITLDLSDPFVSKATKPITTAVKFEKETAEKMPQRTHKSTSESKTRSKNDKLAGHHHGAQASKKQKNLSHHGLAQKVCKQQETHLITGEDHTSLSTLVRLEEKEDKPVTETAATTEKAPSKQHGKKKKKHAQNATGVKSLGEPLVEVENGAKPKTTKGRVDMFEAKLCAKAGRAQKDSDQSHGADKKSQHLEAKAFRGEQPAHHKNHLPKKGPLNDDIKRRRMSEDKFGKIISTLESKLPKSDASIQPKGQESKADVAPKKAYSEVVKQKIPPKEEPKVVKPIQAQAVSGDPQSLCLWCQFTAVFSHHTITWSRDGSVLAEIKRSAGDESRVSLNISNASHKDLGKYQCRLTSSHGSVALDYLLTYEVLGETVIPPSPKTLSSPSVVVGAAEEDVQCSRLMFKEDFLSSQYFGENQPVSIITEKVHFGEGMHRRAFRTKLHAGQIPLLLPGHSCVLKVHNAISYGTKNNDELIQKNFTLAVEECQVQNTAREYIKAYTTAAQSVEAFGEIPEIIPIYLVHRPSNDIPYATLEEELIGDFVKYSVKDGKEINLMRRDSEAGQKCCAFQHWVYHKTEGNLLVTDMQGVGMRLTDVGIATSKKGYKGFKGNCATTFIDQFKALHQCNKYCEILGLKSLQPKAKKSVSALKPKPQPSAASKKKTFGPTAKGKS